MITLGPVRVGYISLSCRLNSSTYISLKLKMGVSWVTVSPLNAIDLRLYTLANHPEMEFVRNATLSVSWGCPLVCGTMTSQLEPLTLLQNILNLLPQLQQISYIYLLSAGIVLGLFYYFVYLPIDWTRDLTEVGYDYFVETPQYKAMRKGKRELVKDVRRRRQIGDLPPIYPNGWFGLLESRDIAPGQVKYVEALGENFAVFRSKDGKVHVLDAYCPHLGANMGIGGVVKGDCLECPFHGWQFKGSDGKCSEIPYSSKVPSFARVKKWDSCEENEFIFVWYHAEGEPPAWQIEPVEQIKSGAWWYRGRSEFFINSHIEEIPENGADAAHLNAIHAPSLLGGSDIRFYQRFWHSFAWHTWKASWSQHTAPGEQHIGTMNLEHELRMFNKFNIITMKVNARQIGPGYVYMHLITTLGPVGIVQSVTPVEPLVQRVIHRVYSAPLMMLYTAIIIIGEAIMFERDIMVWNHKKYVKPLLVKEDEAIVRHRRWYSQFYSANSPRFAFQRDTMDW